MATLSLRDQKHIWHPLTQHKLHTTTIAISKAKGSILYDEDGNEFIDAIASWYTCVYGHCNAYILDKVQAQMQQLDQIVFSGFTHEPAVKLSESLIKILPRNQEKLFFSDNGSTSVEVAIKMALQYHFNAGNKRHTLLAFEDGFHGDTFGAMSVSGLSVYNGPFEDFFLKVKRIPLPTYETIDEILVEIKQLIEIGDLAAFIYEPLIQGAAGMQIYEAKLLEAILSLCKDHQVLTIADEVMTGFGKTGKIFASDYMPTKPDIICLSKALTAGLLPMAITSCSLQIYEAFYSDQMSKGLFHGHTYSANPLACTAAQAGIELLVTKEIQDKIVQLSNWHVNFANHIKNNPKVKRTRCLGTIFALDLAIDMERYGNLRDRLFNFFLDSGVFLRPLGNTIYIAAPYTISKVELDKVYHSIEEALKIV